MEERNNKKRKNNMRGEKAIPRSFTMTDSEVKIMEDLSESIFGYVSRSELLGLWVDKFSTGGYLDTKKFSKIELGKLDVSVTNLEQDLLSRLNRVRKLKNDLATLKETSNTYVNEVLTPGM